MRKTIELIGQTVADSSRYLPIRLRAARAAARAKPKDYSGQAREILADFLHRWRYVKDPVGRELITTAPEQLYDLVMGGDRGIGASDCDDATSAIAAQLASIGFPVRLATTAPVGMPAGRMFSHIFAQAHIPGRGWTTVDPVLYPHRSGFGFIPPSARIAFFDLTGKLIDFKGNAQGLSGDLSKGPKMPAIRTDLQQWDDFAGFGDYVPPASALLPDFRRVGIKDYGIYADTMGISGGYGLVAEVDDEATEWTPALELGAHDYQYLKYNNTPYHGMVALGDNGQVYSYDEGLGFFKKLLKKAKRRAKRIAKRVLKKIPGGKYLLRLGEKLWKISKKLVKPLVKYVGPLAKKLAPIAALIPGYGPAIAAGLHATGKIANLMKKFGVVVKKGKEVGKLAFPSDRVAKAFETELKKEAAIQKPAKARARARIAQGIPPKRRLRRRVA